MNYPENRLDPKWITGEKKIDSETVKWLESFGKFLAISGERDPRPITTTQIRKFFGEVKKIQADFGNKKDQVILLAPKLAYAVGRDEFDPKLRRKKTKIVEFQKELGTAILEINGESGETDHL